MRPERESIVSKAAALLQSSSCIFRLGSKVWLRLGRIVSTIHWLSFRNRGIQIRVFQNPFENAISNFFHIRWVIAMDWPESVLAFGRSQFHLFRDQRFTIRLLVRSL